MIVQKKTHEEIAEEQRSRRIRPYNIFMTMVEKVGHDRRGNTLFKRDEDGNEIWVPENSNVLEMGKVAEGVVAYRTERKTRIIDDQSCEVPSVFEQWKRQEGIIW